MENELAELTRKVAHQEAMIGALAGTVISMGDIICQVIETRNVADRSEIAGRIRKILDRDRGEAERIGLPAQDCEVQRIGHALLDAFVARLETPISPPPAAPHLRVVS